MNLDKIIAKITSDGHIPIGFFIFVVGSLIHVFHGLDASFVAFTTTVLGFLGGHAWVQSKTPPDAKDKPGDTPGQ
jgi:hypothetical protein